MSACLMGVAQLPVVAVMGPLGVSSCVRDGHTFVLVLRDMH